MTLYTVKPGDTLSKIARMFGVPLDMLIAANPQISDPDLISLGQVIIIPYTGITTYTVQWGDSLSGIAWQFYTTVQNLMALNPTLTNPIIIFAGQKIFVPVPNLQPTGCIVFASKKAGTTKIIRATAKGDMQFPLADADDNPHPSWSQDNNIAFIGRDKALYAMDSYGKNKVKVLHILIPNTSLMITVRKTFQNLSIKL